METKDGLCIINVMTF